jgi:hypothetical protein
MKPAIPPIEQLFKGEESGWQDENFTHYIRHVENIALCGTPRKVAADMSTTYYGRPRCPICLALRSGKHRNEPTY